MNRPNYVLTVPDTTSLPHEPVNVANLKRGDVIVNVGGVVVAQQVGAFIVLLVETHRWSLATGTRVTAQEDLVLHLSEEVLVRAAA